MKDGQLFRVHVHTSEIGLFFVIKLKAHNVLDHDNNKSINLLNNHSMCTNSFDASYQRYKTTKQVKYESIIGNLLVLLLDWYVPQIEYNQIAAR